MYPLPEHHDPITKRLERFKRCRASLLAALPEVGDQIPYGHTIGRLSAVLGVSSFTIKAYLRACNDIVDVDPTVGTITRAKGSERVEP